MCSRDRQLGLGSISPSPYLETMNKPLSQTEPQFPHLWSGNQSISLAHSMWGGVQGGGQHGGRSLVHQKHSLDLVAQHCYWVAYTHAPSPPLP